MFEALWRDQPGTEIFRGGGCLECRKQGEDNYLGSVRCSEMPRRILWIHLMWTIRLIYKGEGESELTSHVQSEHFQSLLSNIETVEYLHSCLV